MASDILINQDGTAQIEGGDFAVGLSDMQHASLLINSEKGEFRHQPLLGVGVANYINDERPATLLRQAIRTNLEADSATVGELTVVGGNVNLEVNYG